MGGKDIPPFLEEARELQLLLFEKLDAARTHIQTTLEKKAIPYRLYKGMDLGTRFWPNPSLRPSRDIDILIAPDALYRTENALEDSGYVRLWRANYHTQFRRQGTVFEIHDAPFSYKYRLLFEWPSLSSEDLISQGIDNELTLLLHCIEVFDELGHDRLIPFADLFLLLKTGVDLDKLSARLEQASLAFPILFCHYRHLHLSGLPLFPDAILDRVRMAYRRSQSTRPLSVEKELADLAAKAESKQGLWAMVFRMTQSKPAVLWGLLFPPKNVYGPSLWSYWLRTLRRSLTPLSPLPPKHKDLIGGRGDY